MFSPQQIYDFFTYTVELPKMLGPAHISIVIFTILASIITCYALKDASEKTVRRFLFTAWILLMIMETYRQISYSIGISDGEIYWNYNWGQIPLQVCSVQLYALPFIFILKDGKLRDGFICVMMTWSLIGGMGVTVYPGNTLSTTLGVTIQSMVHHSIQVILGTMFTVRYAKRMNVSHFLRGFVLFMIYFGIAMCANIHVYEHLTLKGKAGSINMFALSPYYDPLVNILKTIREMTNHWTMTFIYMSCFTLASIVLYCIEYRLTKGRREGLKIQQI